MAGPTATSKPGSLDLGGSTSKQEMEEKYKSLKRRFQELEGESGSETNRSEERNVRRREEQDYILAELTEIEQRIEGLHGSSQLPHGITQPNGVATSGEIVGGQQNSDALASQTDATKSSPTRYSVSEKAAASSKRVPGSSSHVAEHPDDIQMTDVTKLSHNTESQTSPRSSQRIATRRSPRKISHTATSIAAIAAVAAEAEAEAESSTSNAVKKADEYTSASPDNKDAGQTSGAPANQMASTLTTSVPPFPPVAGTISTNPNPYASLASMESIVRVAEAAVAAQNALKFAGTDPAQQMDSPSNLDPTLLAESSSAPSLPSHSNNSSADDGSLGASKKLPSVDTTASASSSAAPSASVTPTSTTSTSSNLSNNPYLALATNYQRGQSTSPTGHPLLLPYPFFYPATPVTPGTQTAYIPYNPYYYMAAPVVAAPNGIYAPPQGFVAPNQPASTSQPPPPKQAPPDHRGAKPKRLKSHTVTSKSFSIPMVPRDKQGKPMLPLNVGIMTVISLGNVCMREHFHTERYIFPVGYEVTRRYLSTVDPTIEVVYHCTILDGGDGPKFQIIPSDRPDQPVIAGTATGAWSNIVKQANAIRNRQHSNSVSGPDFFGLGQNTIKHLIQELPNADKLRDYVWQTFVEGGPLGGRHAAVIPALPEEYDASMPIGPYYPRRTPIPQPNVSGGLSYYPQHIIAQAEAQKVNDADPLQQPVAGPSSISAPPIAMPPNGTASVTQHSAAQSLASAINAAVGNVTQLGLYGFPPPSMPTQAPSISAPPVMPSLPVPQPVASTSNRVTRSKTAATGAANNTPSAASSSTIPSLNARHTRSASKAQQVDTGQLQQAPAAPLLVQHVNGDPATQMTFAGIMNAYPFLQGFTTMTLPPGSNHAAGS